MTTSHKWLNITMILVLLLSWLISACSSQTPATPTEEPLVEDFVPVISVTGKVVPSKWSTLSVSTSGVVAEVLVEEGQVVKAGQVLVRLEGKETLQAAIAQAKFEVTSAQQALDDLYENAGVAREMALRAVAEAYEKVRNADRQLYYFTIPANQRDLEMFAAAELMRKNLEEARKAWEPYRYEEDYLIQGNPARKQLKDALEKAEGDFRTAMLRIQYASDLRLAEEQLAKARADYEKLLQGPDPDQVALAQARLENAQAALAAAEASLRDLELLAPFAGTVSEVRVRDSEWVAPGQPVILLADLSDMQVETTDLSEIDVAQVTVGAPVTITFDALPDVSVMGEVVRIAPKDTGGTGVNYTVIIRLGEIPPGLLWGMTAFADIARAQK